MKTISRVCAPLFVFHLLNSICANAQRISPQSVNSAGAQMTQPNDSLSFTVGELVVLQMYDSLGNSISNGFTNSATASNAVTSIEAPEPEVLDMIVYPNPTSDMLNIRVNSTSIDKIVISILDVQGKELSHGIYSGIANTIGINMLGYAQGTYLLLIKNTGNQILGKYQIVKQ